MFLTTVLLTGWLALQDSPKPPKPQDPPRSGDATKNDASKGSRQIDPELRAAIDELRRSPGYRFEVDGGASHRANRPLAGADDSKLPDPLHPKRDDEKSGDKGDDKVAHAKEHGAKMENFHLQGSFQREKPVQIKTDRIEAYRSSDKLVWRGRDQKEWTVIPARVGEPPDEMTEPEGEKSGASGGDGGSDGNRGGGDEARIAKMLANMPLPDDLVRDLESHLVSCQRASGAEKATGLVTYECVVSQPDDDRGDRKEARRNDGARGDAQRADEKHDGKNCALRFTLSEGRIAEIDLRHPAGGAAANAGSPTAPPADPTTDPATSRGSAGKSASGPSITCHYKLSSIGSTEVTVPEDVARLLGSR